MLLRKFKRNCATLHYSLFALIVFVIVYMAEVSESRTIVHLLSSPFHVHNDVHNTQQEVQHRIVEAVSSPESHDATIPVELQFSLVPTIQKTKAIHERQKRSPSSRRERNRSRSNSQSAPPSTEDGENVIEPRNSAGAIAVAVLSNYLKSKNTQDGGDKDNNKNPLDMYNMQIASFIQDQMKKFTKRLKTAVKKLRECITLFPFSIDRACLK